ncbi:hypothetical protein Cgig2_011733 [Carnegiea gigantea]|uniref:Uncharacterized protein n=1 Tax=Carnegiea gigantea TaxID=171969 RepID=A0A9Q1KL38_9CARY|nr:hypothetical protein Cgig2_011733 [Carnegiea gigantea]
MHSRNSPNAPKNTTQESSKKTITDIRQQPSDETDDTVEDTTYKMPPPRHVDESKSDDDVLVKRIKKIKQGTKYRPKKVQLMAKKCVKSQPEKKEDVQKSPKPPVKSGQLSVIKHKKEHKSLKKKEHAQKHAAVPIEGPKSMQSMPKPTEGDTKYKKIFQSRMSSSRFDPYSVTLYISLDKKIEITPMDVHITLALPIGGRKVEEFYEKKPKDAKYNEVLDAWRKDRNSQDEAPKLSQMPQYILSQADAEESFKRNFIMYMVSCFFNGSKNEWSS